MHAFGMLPGFATEVRYDTWTKNAPVRSRRDAPQLQGGVWQAGHCVHLVQELRPDAGTSALKLILSHNAVAGRSPLLAEAVWKLR